MVKRNGKICLRGRFIAMLMTVVLVFTVMPVTAKAEGIYRLEHYMQFGTLTSTEALYKILEDWRFYDAKSDTTYMFELISEEEKMIGVRVYSDDTVEGYIYTVNGINRMAVSGAGVGTHRNVQVYVHWYMDGTEELHCIIWDPFGYDHEKYIPEPEKEGYVFTGWVDKKGRPINENATFDFSCYSAGQISTYETYIYATWAQHEHDWDDANWEYDENAHWHKCLAEDCPITENRKKDGYAEHEFSDWTIISEAKFNEDGLKKRNCNICGYEEEEIIPKLSDSHVHEFEGEEEIIRDPKCYEPGLKKVYCTLDECGEYEESEIAKIPHDYEEDYRYSDVIHYHKCINCDDCIDEDYHEMTDWNVVNEATFSEDGLKERHCTECEYEENEILKKLSATHEHDYTGREEIVSDSTCTKEGVKKIYCYEEQCGAYIEQAIPKKEHDYEIGWLYDEDIHYHKCKNCEAYKDDAAHNMVETSMVKLASKTSPGIMEYECTTCRYVDYEEVPYVEPPVEEKEDEQVSDKELPPFNAPQTEDIKVVHIYATMAMIGGMTYLLCYFKPIDVSMTEETKKKLVDKLIKWAKSKNRLVKMIALVGISVVLFYYHFMANCRKRNAKVSESADTL